VFVLTGMKQFIFLRSMNISLQLKKFYYKLLRALTIISKVTVSVSKYKPLSIGVIIVFFLFYNVVLSSSKTVENTLSALLALGASST